MKVVIIGGGIAGLTLGLFLRKKNHEVVVNERGFGLPQQGHAFLMHIDGIQTLKELNTDNKAVLDGEPISTYSLRRPGGDEVKHLQLHGWRCIRRSSLISFLHSLFPSSHIKEDRVFSKFVYENGKAVAAVFENGEVENGDLFIGADGGNSKVREELFGKVNFTPVKVKEILGVCKNEKLYKEYASSFSKFQRKDIGLAFGFIPTAENEFVWFMQYDPSLADVQGSNAEEMKAFCLEQVKDFPKPVKDLLGANDFSKTYIWNTRDFDLLSSFHRNNVALIGDAAHQALPFTSAGTTNAIVDAKTIAECLDRTENYEQAFRKFYQLRSDEVSKHIHLGRDLQKLFLNPRMSDDEIPVPLISQRKVVDMGPERKQIKVLYFTDPICSTCWIIQPLLRRLKLEYDNYLDVEYKMGGLLPSWEQYQSGKIRKPTDAAKHWEDVAGEHNMPLDGDVWIEDPLASSYPPSIAFKAAQLQDTNLAILFLRRIKEMVFIEKKNIIKWEFLKKAAYDVGLDAARLLRDYNGKAIEMFREDLVLASKLGVTSFPTLFFSDQYENNHTIKGYQPYERFEDVIRRLVPSARREKINNTPENLFSQFSTMAEKEFAFLSDMPLQSANKILNDLFIKGTIDKYVSKNGVIWKSKSAACCN